MFKILSSRIMSLITMDKELGGGDTDFVDK
jgi:hypothetical protein